MYPPGEAAAIYKQDPLAFERIARRVQKTRWLQVAFATVAVGVGIGFNLSILGCVCVVLLAAYLPSLFDGSERTPEGKFWPEFACLNIWKWLCAQYFSGEVIDERDEEERKNPVQTIFGMHPHVRSDESTASSHIDCRVF